MITYLKANWAKFYFKSVCIKLVALRINVYEEVALRFKKVGDPWSKQKTKQYLIRDSFPSFITVASNENGRYSPC